ncbi:MAG TPA: hypothetical protein VII99_06810 [Bacteroidia bacterium]
MQIRKFSKHIVGEGDNSEKVLKDVYKALRGNISFGKQGANVANPTLGLVTDNIDGAFATINDSGPANSQFALTHNLNRIPIGYICIRQDESGSFYDDNTTAVWTTTQIFLKSDAAHEAATFFIF